MAADRELNHSDRRRSLKRRYLHLQVARRSQFLSGSGGTSADSKRKFASDRAASHAPSPAMTSAPLYFLLRFPPNMVAKNIPSARISVTIHSRIRPGWPMASRNKLNGTPLRPCAYRIAQ